MAYNPSDTNLPDSFRNVCRQLGQDLDLALALPGATIFGLALSGTKAEQIPELVGFIGGLLSGNLTDDELQSFWFSTPASVHFENGAQLRQFLSELRDVAMKAPYTKSS